MPRVAARRPLAALPSNAPRPAVNAGEPRPAVNPCRGAIPGGAVTRRGQIPVRAGLANRAFHPLAPRLVLAVSVYYHLPAERRLAEDGRGRLLPALRPLQPLLVALAAHVDGEGSAAHQTRRRRPALRRGATVPDARQTRRAAPLPQRGFDGRAQQPPLLDRVEVDVVRPLDDRVLALVDYVPGDEDRVARQLDLLGQVERVGELHPFEAARRAALLPHLGHLVERGGQPLAPVGLKQRLRVERRAPLFEQLFCAPELRAAPLARLRVGRLLREGGVLRRRASPQERVSRQGEEREHADYEAEFSHEASPVSKREPGKARDFYTGARSI